MIDLNFFKENPELASKIKIEVTGADLMAFAKNLHDLALADAQKIAESETEEYLTPAQMSQILHVSLTTLWSWDRKKIIEPVYIGNKKLYKRSDLEKCLTR